MAGAFSMRISRTLAVVGLLIGAAVGLVAVTMGLLYATTTKPRVTEGWLLGPSLPAARGELATAIAYGEQCVDPPCPQAERLYVLGGLSRFFRPLRSVTVFDPNRKLWTVGPSLPAPRHHFAAAAVGQTLYVSGGTTVAGLHLGMAWPPMDNFWRLTTSSDRWESLGPMIEPRWGHRMVAHKGRLYVVGGRGPSGRVLIYTPNQGWSFGAELPRPRDHLSVVVVRRPHLGNRWQGSEKPRPGRYLQSSDGHLAAWSGTPGTDERCSRGRDQRRHLHLWRRGAELYRWRHQRPALDVRHAWRKSTMGTGTRTSPGGSRRRWRGAPRRDGHSWRLNPARSPLAHGLVERAAADEARGAPKINSSCGSEGYSPLCISSWTGCAPFVI